MKSVKYLFAVTIFILLHPVNSYSQSNFLTGYVIDIQKDTIKGFIDYRNWNKTPKEILFKNISDSRLIIYTPSDINSFSVADERYVSAVVAIDDSPVRDGELTESDLPQNRIDTVFLQSLIEGPKSLYYHKDNNLKVHFFIGQNGVMEPLVYKKYLQSVDGQMFVKENEQFKGQLFDYFQDCPSVQKKIYSLSYSKNELIKLFSDYYKSTNIELFYNQEPEKFKTEFGLLAGLSQTKLKFAGTDFFKPLTGADFPWSNNFTFGGFFNLVIPRMRDRLSINNELTFVSYKTSGQYRDNSNTDIYTISYSSFSHSYIKLNTLLKYKFPVKRIFLFVDCGISNGISFSQKNFMRVEAHVYSLNNISEHEAIASPRSWERGFLMGLGCNGKNFLCEFRFERADGISDVPGLTSPSIMHLVILGYKF